ncbi:MAG: HEAT repeat domain-containing protein [Planctomycetota bacterium]
MSRSRTTTACATRPLGRSTGFLRTRAGILRGSVGTLPFLLLASVASAQELPAARTGPATLGSGLDSEPGPTPTHARGAERYVVVLASGGVVRGPAEPQENGAVRVRGTDGVWKLLPAGAVERVAPEDELLAEWRRVRRGTELEPAQRLDWLVARGLFVEGFQEADRLLDVAPHDADLRAVASRLGAQALPKGADLRALRKAGGTGSAAVQEAALRALPTSAPRADVLGALRDAVRSKNAEERGFALAALGRLFPSEDPRLPILHAMWDPSPRVRAKAARTLGDIGAREVARPLVDGLWSPTALVRVRSAEALGETGDPVAVEPLLDRYFALRAPKNPKVPVTRPLTAAAPAPSGRGSRPARAYALFGRQRAYIQDFDVEVASFASVADPTIGILTEASVLDVGVVSVTEVSVLEERRVVLRSLVRASGVDLGKRPDAWRSWWDSPAAAPFRPK